MMHPTEDQIDTAIDTLRRAIDAAENSNNAGERAVWKAYRALNPAAPEWDDEPEPESYDDALGRRCDTEARLKYDLIGAGRGHLVAR